MIQRIQSVYLFLAAVAMAVYMFFPAMVSEDGVAIGAFTPQYVILALSALVTLLSLITIFKFKDLKGQSRLCKIGILLTAALLISVGVLCYTFNGFTPSWFNVLPVATAVFLTLASKGVAHDRKLLSDSTRLR